MKLRSSVLCMVAESVASDRVWQAPGVRIDNSESEMFRRNGKARFRDAARQASNVECSDFRKMWLRFFDKVREIGA